MTCVVGSQCPDCVIDSGVLVVPRLDKREETDQLGVCGKKEQSPLSIMLTSKLWFILVLYCIEVWVTALTAPNRRGYRFQQPEAKEGAYEIAAAAEIKVPCIILVNPFLDQNVGSVSRAMLNFGLHELRVVDPRCDILSDQARALASRHH